MNMRAFFKLGRKTVKIYDHGTDWQFLSSDGERWFTKHSTLAESQSLGLALSNYTNDTVKLTDLEIL